jgi:hypothetical protein
MFRALRIALRLSKIQSLWINSTGLEIGDGGQIRNKAKEYVANLGQNIDTAWIFALVNYTLGNPYPEQKLAIARSLLFFLVRRGAHLDTDPTVRASARQAAIEMLEGAVEVDMREAPAPPAVDGDVEPYVRWYVRFSEDLAFLRVAFIHNIDAFSDAAVRSVMKNEKKINDPVALMELTREVIAAYKEVIAPLVERRGFFDLESQALGSVADYVIHGELGRRLLCDRYAVPRAEEMPRLAEDLRQASMIWEAEGLES